MAMHKMIISDGDVQVIKKFTLNENSIFKQTKKVLTVFKISFYVELFELSILRILHWFIIKSIIFIYYFKEAFFSLKLNFVLLWQLKLSWEITKKCLCIFILN